MMPESATASATESSVPGQTAGKDADSGSMATDKGVLTLADSAVVNRCLALYRQLAPEAQADLSTFDAIMLTMHRRGLEGMAALVAAAEEAERRACHDPGVFK